MTRIRLGLVVVLLIAGGCSSLNLRRAAPSDRRHFTSGLVVSETAPKGREFCLILGSENPLTDKGLPHPEEYPDLFLALQKSLAARGIEAWSPWEKVTPVTAYKVMNHSVEFRERETTEPAHVFVIPPGEDYWGLKSSFASVLSKRRPFSEANLAVSAKKIGATYVIRCFYRILDIQGAPGQKKIKLAVWSADLKQFNPHKPESYKQHVTWQSSGFIEGPTSAIQSIADSVVRRSIP